MLTAEGVRNTCCAARVKLPVSAMATKVRRISISRMGSPWGEFTVLIALIMTTVQPMAMVQLFLSQSLFFFDCLNKYWLSHYLQASILRC